MSAAIVSEPAVELRIKRRLARDGKQLRRCRVTSRWFNDLGRFYVVDSSNHICDKFSDLEERARALGVLRADEVVAT